MMIQFVVDMNLSPDWVPVLVNKGWYAQHWSAVGDPRATDQEIMKWAVAQGCVVLTHDLDFGTILALTQATGPSVVQVRGQDVLPDTIVNTVVAAIKLYEADLSAGALLVIDIGKSRVRILPI